MPIKFDGRKIRDKILEQLKGGAEKVEFKPTLAVVWIGDDPVSEKYIRIKEKIARDLGVNFQLIKLPRLTKYSDILQNVRVFGKSEVDGVMIQMPLPEWINAVERKKIIREIPAKKDIDGLRFCAGLPSNFQPPVVLAILEAIKKSKVDLKKSRVAIIGQGFLVGAPLGKILKNQVKELLLANIHTADISEITRRADVVISAAGKPGLITSKIIKSGAVLIDAGTTEVGGKIAGDIDPRAFEKASFYTPVPGGIGPVTVAMLFQNLIRK